MKLNLWRKTALDKNAWIKACVALFDNGGANTVIVVTQLLSSRSSLVLLKLQVKDKMTF